MQKNKLQKEEMRSRRPSREFEMRSVEMFITENIHQNSEVVQRSHNPIDMGRELVIFLAPGGQHHSIASH